MLAAMTKTASHTVNLPPAASQIASAVASPDFLITVSLPADGDLATVTIYRGDMMPMRLTELWRDVPLVVSAAIALEDARGRR